MNHTEILDRIKNVIARVTGLEIEEIGEDDSLLEIDREFMGSKVKIPNERLPDIKTLGEAASRIQLELAKV